MIDDPVMALLWHIAETGTLLTAAQVLGEDPEGSADALAGAIGRGLVDAVEDFGPETLFTLSTAGAAMLGVQPTYDSRRWQSSRNGRLIGEHEQDGRYRDRRPNRRQDEVEISLESRVDRKALRPDQILEMAEKYSGDDPLKAPPIHRFYGITPIWAGEEEIDGKCPYCKSATIGIHAYCLKCHNAGMDRLMVRPKKNVRKQMPRTKSKLKGGV